MIDRKRPNPIDSKQVKRKKDDRNQSNDRRVLYLRGTGPRHATHLGTGIANELSGSREESRRGRALLSATASAARRESSALRLFWRFATWRFGRLSARRLRFEFELFFAHVNVV